MRQSPEKNFIRWLVVPALALAAGACASSGTADFDEISIADGVDLAAYDKVYIADVQIGDELRNRDPHPPLSSFGKQERPVSEKDLAAKAEDLHKELSDEIGDYKQLVSAPGPDVLTVQAVILDMTANQPTMADITANPSLALSSRYAGGSDVQVSFVNNGQTLATVRDSYQSDLGNARKDSIWGDTNLGFYKTAYKMRKILL